MKLKRLTLAIVLASMGLTATAQQTLQLSLSEAQQYAIEHNATMKNADLEVKKAEMERWKTLSSMLPSLKAGFDYQNMCGYTMNFGGGGSMMSMMPDSVTIGGVTMPISFPSSGSSNTSSGGGIAMNPSGTFSLTAAVALSGAQVVGTMMQKLALEMTDLSRQQTEQQTRSQVKNVYVSILVMEQTVGLLDSSLANLESLAATSQAAVNVGAAEQVDADKLQVQVASMKSSINSTKRSLQMLRNSLLLQLGADVNSTVELTTPIDDILSIEGAASILNTPFHIENNYNYQLLAKNEELATRQVNMAWMDFLPTISAYYQYSAKTYFGKDEGFNMTPPNMIGASISMPLLSSGTRYASVKSAKIAQQETARQDLALAQQQATQQVQQAQADMQKAYKQATCKHEWKRTYTEDKDETDGVHDEVTVCIDCEKELERVTVEDEKEQTATLRTALKALLQGGAFPEVAG